MSALGHKQTNRQVGAISAIAPNSRQMLRCRDCSLCARFGNASLYRREVAPTASDHCDLWTFFPKVISCLRKPIAIQAAISLNMNLPE
jgi:hypothetical protein